MLPKGFTGSPHCKDAATLAGLQSDGTAPPPVPSKLGLRHRSRDAAPSGPGATSHAARQPGGQGSPLLGGLHPHRQRGHGGDGLGFLLLALLGLDQRVGRGGGQAPQRVPVLAWGGSAGSPGGRAAGSPRPVLRGLQLDPQR